MDNENSEKQISAKKIEANRRNSAKSTGPRTLRGKKNSCLNALRHGLLAKSVVVLEGAGREDAAAFASLLNDLRGDIQPVGVREELLVNEIAAYYWRLDRAFRCEVGEIRLSFVDGGMSSLLGSIELGVEHNPERESISSHLSIPAKDAMDRVLRYECVVHGRLYKAMNQLATLQRQRKGDAASVRDSNGSCQPE